MVKFSKRSKWLIGLGFALLVLTALMNIGFIAIDDYERFYLIRGKNELF